MSLNYKKNKRKKGRREKAKGEAQIPLPSMEGGSNSP